MGALSGQSITVLGAGVIGTALALTLRRRGADVTLVEATCPGAACSAGNGGMIQIGSSLPLAQPGILRQVPGMITDPEGALVLRPARIPAMLPWARDFLRSARPQAAEAGEKHLASLLAGATPAWDRLRASSPVADLFRERGELYVTRSAQVFAGLDHKRAVCARNGVTADVLDGPALRRMEPALAPDYAHGLYLPGSSYVISPKAVCQALHDQFLAEGGQAMLHRVAEIRRNADGVILHAIDGTKMNTRRLVMATGAVSGQMRGLGTRLPLEPLRGYNVTLGAADLALNGPVIEAEMNIAVTPMTGGPRVAGTLEFAGFRRAPDWRRAEMLLPLAQRMLPGLDTACVTERWSGERPGTPDSLPLLGPATDKDDPVWVATGHGMLGLTLAAHSAELVADGLAGDTAALAPFHPARFRRRAA